MERSNMKGKRVLVTGSGTGIGRGMAIEFARHGADVALHYSHSKDGAASAVEEIRQAGGKAEAFQADFTDIKQVKNLPLKAADFLGGLDVLVNNAGITLNLPFEQTTPEQFDTVFNVNLKAMFFAIQSAEPIMLKQGKGAVVNISSGHAFAAMNEHSVYAATKSGIVGLTRTLAVELIQKGIRVNAVASGWVLVENQQAQLPADFDKKKAGTALPAGFIGEPEDIGRLVIFLASDDARYIVGQTFICDGGQTALMRVPGDWREPEEIKRGIGYVPGL